MYVLGADSSIIVVGLAGSNHGKASVQKQHLPLAEQGDAGLWQGMAIYPSGPSTILWAHNKTVSNELCLILSVLFRT